MPRKTPDTHKTPMSSMMAEVGSGMGAAKATVEALADAAKGRVAPKLLAKMLTSKKSMT